MGKSKKLKLSKGGQAGQLPLAAQYDEEESVKESNRVKVKKRKTEDDEVCSLKASNLVQAIISCYTALLTCRVVHRC